MLALVARGAKAAGTLVFPSLASPPLVVAVVVVVVVEDLVETVAQVVAVTVLTVRHLVSLVAPG